MSGEHGSSEVEQRGEMEVVHKHNVDVGEDDMYVGRSWDGEGMDEVPVGERGWLGNPYEMGEDGTRSEVVRAFAHDFVVRLARDDEFRAAVDGLEADRLVGWCAPKECHGDVIQMYVQEGIEAVIEEWEL